jgi:oxygen-independent coproporphyrinogen-3 oxidase
MMGTLSGSSTANGDAEPAGGHSSEVTPAVPSVAFDEALIRKYDKRGPRYTSYPTALQFRDSFSEQDYRHNVVATNVDPSPAPLSLYFHLPFCDTVCYYCACTKVITRNRRHAADYLQHLHHEMRRQAALYDRDRQVVQLHWGGGTPTFLNPEQMGELMHLTSEHFTLAEEDYERSIEIDPRTVNEETMSWLRELGFNRVSFGIQDFNERVQRAVNRIQSEEQTSAVLEMARALEFKSVSVDLIYGLPHQSTSSFAQTIDKIIELSPDRISVFNYAHLPQLFKVQRQISPDTLPTPNEKLRMLAQIIRQLAEAGYAYIGMDHFAKPGDELAIAQKKHTLWRNFQGYSTHSECDLLGLGMSSISMVGNCYSQNARNLEDYYRLIVGGGLPVARGIELSHEDRLRRRVILQLSCWAAVDIPAIERDYHIDFGAHFAAELRDLQEMQADRLLNVTESSIEVLPPGRLLLRNICMVFDSYLRNAAPERTYSKVI